MPSHHRFYDEGEEGVYGEVQGGDHSSSAFGTDHSTTEKPVMMEIL